MVGGTGNSVVRGKVSNVATLYAPSTVDVVVNPKFSEQYTIREVLVMAPPATDLAKGDSVVVWFPTGRPSDGAYAYPVHATPNVTTGNFGEAKGGAELLVRGEAEVLGTEIGFLRGEIELREAYWSFGISLSAPSPSDEFDSVVISGVGLQTITANAVPDMEVWGRDERTGGLIATMRGGAVSDGGEVVFSPEYPLTVKLPTVGTTHIYLVPIFRGLTVGSRSMKMATTTSSASLTTGMVGLATAMRIYPPWRAVGYVPLIRLYGHTE